MAATVVQSGKGKITDDSVQITFEDQQRINMFARKNAKLNEIKAGIEKKKKDLQNLEDAENDLLLLEAEVDSVPFQIGEAFIHVSMDEANQLIESRKQNIEEDLKGLDSQTDELKSILADLKVKLYGKFGNNINLEEDED